MRGVRGTTVHAQEDADGRAGRFRRAFLREFGWRIKEMRLREVEGLAAQGKYRGIVEWCRRNPKFVQEGMEMVHWEMEKAYRAAMDGKGRRPAGAGRVLEFIALRAEDWTLGAWAVRELVEDGEMGRVRKVAGEAADEKVRGYATKRL